MTDRFFPIRTTPACQLKWTWSTIFLYEGQTSSCHRVKKDNLDPNDFNNFHNTPGKLIARQKMLDGEWPGNGCEHCKKIEDNGQFSDRLFHVQIPNLYPKELDESAEAINVTPRILEIYLDNVCNMSCIYCASSNSSRIEQENNKFGRFDCDGVIIENKHSRTSAYDQNLSNLWKWLENNYKELRRLHILGGEPFFQSQFEPLLEFIENNENKDLELNIVSNLKVPKEKFVSYIERFKKLTAKRKIKRFDLTCSIDCWDAEQEYIRHGMDLEQWKENFEIAVAQKWLVLNINQTLTNLGMKTVDSLLKYINIHRNNREIGHYFSVVLQYDYLTPGIFGAGFFDKEFHNILECMPETTWQQQQAKKMMQGIYEDTKNCSRDNNEIKKLFVYLTELDRRRGTNWKETFPWLVEEFESIE